MRLPLFAAGLGASLALTIGAAPAFADPSDATVSPTSAGFTHVAALTTTVPQTSTSKPAMPTVPAFPGFDAPQDELATWANAVATQYHLSAPPTQTAGELAWSSYVQRLMTALGAPSQDATQAEWEAWLTKAAGMLGLTPPPATTASNDAWLAWFQDSLGLDVPALLDELGAQAMLDEPSCVDGHGGVGVHAINLSSAPAVLVPFLDAHALQVKISLAGSPLTADEPSTYEGRIAVPDGHHVVSIVDSSTGETLDSVTTDLMCSVPSTPKPTPTTTPSAPATTKPTTAPSAPAPSSTSAPSTSSVPATPILPQPTTSPTSVPATAPTTSASPATLGPKIQTDYTGSTTPSRDEAPLGALAFGLASCIGVALTRFARR